MKKIILVLFVLTAFSCQKKEETKADNKEACADSTKTAGKDKKFEMYEMSEMAALMSRCMLITNV